MSTTVDLSAAGAAVREMIAAEIAAVRADFKAATEDGFFAIQPASPVDSHRFQASHRLAANAPSGYVEPAGSTHPLAGQDHVDAVFAALGEGDGVIWHESNLPYSNRLAYQGWSAQAPIAGWMEFEYHNAFEARFGGGA